MRVAFYAPMKPPTASRPSGDRLIAQLLIRALKSAGHEVTLASTLRSYDKTGDPERQTVIRRRAEKLLPSVLEKLTANPPDLWFTYHLYHRAPDWLGPPISDALKIPYVVAEASFAPKQKDGPWGMGHQAVAAALAKASHVFSLRPLDRECVAPLLGAHASDSILAPFLDTMPFRNGKGMRPNTREELAARHRLPLDRPWLLAAGMFRHDDRKWPSYQLLAKAMAALEDQPWHLLIAGTGPAERDVKALFEPLSSRVTWLGEVPHAKMPSLYAASDLFVWPSINEAVGMALLEAMASGRPVLTGKCGSVADAIAEIDGAIVVPDGDAAAFATELGELLQRANEWPALGQSAANYVQQQHGLATAAQAIDSALLPIVGKSA